MILFFRLCFLVLRRRLLAAEVPRTRQNPRYFCLLARSQGNPPEDESRVPRDRSRHTLCRYRQRAPPRRANGRHRVSAGDRHSNGPSTKMRRKEYLLQGNLVLNSSGYIPTSRPYSKPYLNLSSGASSLNPGNLSPIKP